MANLPLITDAFSRARAHEALAQSLVADASARRYPLKALMQTHVAELAEVSDLQMAWWLHRTWFMLARREVPRLRSRTSPSMASTEVAETLIETFQRGPAMSTRRAELVQVLASQSLPFLTLDEPVATARPVRCLIEAEWDLAVSETTEGKAEALAAWAAAVAPWSFPLAGVALQRMLDPDQFWQVPHVGRKQTTDLLPWASAPGWALSDLRGHLRSQVRTALWATFLPMIEACFPSHLPDLSEIASGLGVPLMVPSPG